MFLGEKTKEQLFFFPPDEIFSSVGQNKLFSCVKPDEKKKSQKRP